MAKPQMTFQRYEIKYRISRLQMLRILYAMAPYMEEDPWGKSTICNIYFDTPDYRLVRHSQEKPVYKEKLRLRSYGKATVETPVFLELKKKYKSIVYKRRITLPEADAMAYLFSSGSLPDSQIAREIDYFIHHYGDMLPAVQLSYDRIAYYSKTDPNFRVTFDGNILFREENLSLRGGIYGTPLLPRDQVLMEVKTAGAIPLWMTALLTEMQIRKTSFSKYGEAYETICREAKGGLHYA